MRLLAKHFDKKWGFWGGAQFRRCQQVGLFWAADFDNSRGSVCDQMPGCQLFVRVGVCYYEVAFNVIHTYPLGLVPVLARAMGTYPPSAAAALLGQCARHALAVRGGELCERHLHHALTASLNTVLIRIYAQNVQIRGQFYDSQTNTVCAA